MLTNKLTSFAIGGFIAIALLAMAASLLFKQEAKASPSWISNILTTATTSTAYSVTSTSQRILATTTNVAGLGASYTRVYASICNPSGTVVGLNMNQDKPVTSSTTITYIAAAAGYSACYEITDKNLYQGSVQASSSAATTIPVFVTEYVQ